MISNMENARRHLSYIKGSPITRKNTPDKIYTGDKNKIACISNYNNLKVSIKKQWKIDTWIIVIVDCGHFIIIFHIFFFFPNSNCGNSFSLLISIVSFSSPCFNAKIEPWTIHTQNTECGASVWDMWWKANQNLPPPLKLYKRHCIRQ